MKYFKDEMKYSFQAEFSKVQKMPKKPKQWEDKPNKDKQKKDYSQERQRKRGEMWRAVSSVGRAEDS